MKKLFTFWLLLLMSVASFAQWSPTNYNREGKSNTSKEVYFKLNLNELRSQLADAQEMGKNSRPVVLSIPTLDGKIENFNVYSFPVVASELAKQYQLGSYTGVGVNDPSKTVRFSLAPNDFQCMIYTKGEYQFIDPVDKNLGIYAVHPKSKPSLGGKAFVCTTQEDPVYKAQMQSLYAKGNSFTNNPADFSRSSDKKYRTMRLAMSVTGEYTQYFGGTVAGALTAVNATVTRVNGVYEKDFALHLNVQNFPQLIYTNPATDPYSPSAQMNNWNNELQQNLTNTIGNAAYDIGHLFGADGGGGNAGCIGCVCINPTGPANNQKGSGFTSPADGIPQGDNFDIDYVAHEMGHQLGANHTFSHGLEGAGVNVEPGSGSTIMGYAGITGPNTDVQQHSDAYFHTVSIGQVQTNLINKTCDVETPITTDPPVIAAFTPYNIPKGTAFVLTGSATTTLPNAAMTYVWEERDNATVTINKNNLGNTTSGASFRSIAPSANATRYFPRLSSVLNGVLNNSNNLWEAVSTVARTQNFAFTVRDNNPTVAQQQTQTATQQVIVGNDGPFKVNTTSVNNNVPTTVTWDVVNTNNAPYNSPNVKIDYTTDNGATWTVVAATTPNDGTEAVTFTGLTNGQTIKLRISSIGNVFYAVSTATVVAAPTVATLPYIQPFTNNDFTFSNGTQANKWVYGSATGNPANSIYISNNNGASNDYTITTASVTHAYNDFAIPAGSTTATISFDWKAMGESGIDYMRVWLVPSTFNPVPGTQITALAGQRIQIGANYGMQSSWQTYLNTALNIAPFAGNNMRLVFEWRNDASVGTQNAAAVDNINLLIPTCQVPTNITFTAIGQTSATINWTAANPVPAMGYEYYISTTNTPPTAATAPTGTSATTSATATGLIPNTVYFVWVRSRCTATDTSIWMNGGNFVTGQIPATLPYTQPFNNNDFSFNNGTQPNKWFYGAAAGNPANAIYISDNATGTTNNYNINATSVTHAYRDFTIPTGASIIANFSFDWRGVGEGSADYMRVWLVPTSYILVPGTQIPAGGGRMQVGGNYNQKADWQNYFNPTLNITSFAGQTMRLVFEWRNDPSLGTQTPAAVDNINLVIPTCQVPTNITITNIGPNTATINWTAANPVPANGYQYYVSTSNTPPTSATIPTGSSATSPAIAIGLLPNTTYFVWVRSKCVGTDTSLWMVGPSFVTGQIPATLPYTEPFNNNSFTFVNGTQPNKWFWGSATGNPANSIYISDDVAGATNNYNVSGQSVVQAYRDIAIPTGTTNATLTFDWKGMGESSYDYMRVWMVPTTFMPVAGTQTTAGAGRIQIAGNFNQQTNWQTYFNPSLNVGSFAGQTMRLVFEWRNDTSGGTQPPAAVDNINLLIPTCQVPTNVTITNVTATTATLSWTAANPLPAGGYQYYISPNNTPPTVATTPTGSSPTSPVNLTGLLSNTTYFVWVRSKCVGTDVSLWMPGSNFTTGQIPANFPYVQNFTGPNANDFTLANGGQPNKWVVGSVTGNPANSLYISTDNGVTNNYNISATSVTHAYRDIAIPLGTTNVIFEFDWKADGEGTWDNLQVWLVPVSYLPVPGTAIVAGTDRIQVGGNYQGQTTWQQFSNQNFNLSSFANKTMRLVFQWKNDSGGGTQPPAAVDNIRLVKCSNATPNLTIANITSTTATANWTGDLGGATYVFQYRPLGSTTWITVPLAAGSTTYLMQNLQPFTQYETQLTAYCNNTGGTPATANFTTPCSTAAPLNLTVSNVLFTSADLNWTASAGVTYQVRYREVGTTVWQPTPAMIVNTNSAQLTGLTPGKTYEVQVANICSGTVGAWSASQVFTCPTTCDMSPTGLTVTQITNVSALANWNGFPGATYIVRIRKVGAMMWNTLTSTVPTYTFTGLTENTQYEVQVANVCSGTNGNFSPLYLFTTSGIVYCNQTSHNSTSEHISNVTVKNSFGVTMSNDSGPSNYTSFVAVPQALVRLYKGTSNNQISIEKKWASTTYNEAVVVWIDFNRNGIFELSERIVNSPANQTSPITATFNVPTNAFVSITDDKFILMRVAMMRDGVPSACVDFDNGEVEDYKVLIIEPPLNNALDPNSIQIYPNPVKDNILHVTKVKDGAKYKIYDSAGRIVKNGVILANKINLDQLISGVYIIDIDNNGETAQKKFIKE